MAFCPQSGSHILFPVLSLFQNQAEITFVKHESPKHWAYNLSEVLRLTLYPAKIESRHWKVIHPAQARCLLWNVLKQLSLDTWNLAKEISHQMCNIFDSLSQWSISATLTRLHFLFVLLIFTTFSNKIFETYFEKFWQFDSPVMS